MVRYREKSGSISWRARADSTRLQKATEAYMKPINNSTKHRKHDLYKCEQEFIKWACGNTGGSGKNAGKSEKRLTKEKRIAKRAKLEAKMLKQMRKIDVIGPEETLSAAAVRIGLTRAPPVVEEETEDDQDSELPLSMSGFGEEDHGHIDAELVRHGDLNVDEENDRAACFMRQAMATEVDRNDEREGSRDGVKTCNLQLLGEQGGPAQKEDFEGDEEDNRLARLLLQEIASENAKEEQKIRLKDDVRDCNLHGTRDEIACAEGMEITAAAGIPTFSDVSASTFDPEPLVPNQETHRKRKRQDDGHLSRNEDQEQTKSHGAAEEYMQATLRVKALAARRLLPPNASFRKSHRPNPEEIEKRRARSRGVKEAAALQQMKVGVVDPALIVVDNIFDYVPPKRQKRAHFENEPEEQHMASQDQVAANECAQVNQEYSQNMHTRTQSFNQHLNTIIDHTQDHEKVRQILSQAVPEDAPLPEGSSMESLVDHLVAAKASENR